MTSRRWPKLSWVPIGGWDPSLPEPPPRPKGPPEGPPEGPQNRRFRGGRVRPIQPAKSALIGPGLSAWEGLVLPLIACAVFALIMGGIIYAAAKAEAAEPTCVALSSTGPGVGTHGEFILWSGWACGGDDDLWRWSHPASWDPVTVSETPPVEVLP